MSSAVEYPKKEDFEFLISYLQKHSHHLKRYLPKTDNRWTDRIMQKVELIQLPYYPKDVYHQAAVLFYKINKAHSEIDSNKRSAIIATYLFLLINNMSFVNANEIRLLAKRIAKSKGRKNEDKWIEKVKILFKEKLLYKI